MSEYSSLFGNQLRKGKESVSIESLSGKVVGLYFSAHWCPPCRAFTPLLRRAYLEAVKKGANFEVVFCSFDSSAADFEEYYGSMPWLAVPFEEKSVRSGLADKFGVDGIPTLLLLDETGVYNAEGRSYVTRDPSGFPWRV